MDPWGQTRLIDDSWTPMDRSIESNPIDPGSAPTAITKPDFHSKPGFLKGRAVGAETLD